MNKKFLSKTKIFQSEILVSHESSEQTTRLIGDYNSILLELVDEFNKQTNMDQKY